MNIILGKIVKLERKVNQHSQSELASFVQVNQSSISRVEAGDDGISLELYEQLINYYGMSVFSTTYQLKDLLMQIYNAYEWYHSDQLDTIYEGIRHYEQLHYTEHYVKKLIEAIYFLYYKKLEELRTIIPYLSECTFLFDEEINHIFQVVYAYYLYLEKDFFAAEAIISTVSMRCNEINHEDGILYYLTAWNGIFTKRYSLAQMILHKASIFFKKQKNEKRLFYVERLRGILFFYVSNYHDSIEYLEKCLENETLLKEHALVDYYTNLYLASSYLFTGQYDKAIHTLKLNIDQYPKQEETKYHVIYILACFKLSNDHDTLQANYEEFKDTGYLNDPLINIIVDILVNNDSEQLKAFYNNFHLLSEQIYNKDHLYPHTKLLFYFYRNSIWDNRKYLVYKQLDDIILKNRLGVVLNGI